MKCRLCLANFHNALGIPLFNNDEETNTTKLIAKYLFIEICELDTISKMICKDCFQRLNEFDKFFRHIQTRQQILKELLDVKSSTLDEERTVEVEEVFTNALHPNDELMLNLQDVINDNERLDGPQSAEEFGFADDCESEETEEDVPLQKLKTEIRKKKVRTMVTGKKTQRRKTKRKKRTEMNSKKKEEEEEDSNQNEDANKKTEKLKNCLTAEENKQRDELVSKHIDLKCEICDTQTDSYEELKAHFRKEHNRKAFLTCCGKRFVRRFLLLDHIQSHIDPNLFKCKTCDKVLKSRVSLNLHNSNMHRDREEMKYACHLCGKRFQHPSNLNSHMNVHAEERNFICEICQKGFKSNNLLKMHTQNLHGERTPYICETCGKEYKFKLSFDRHIAEHQGKPNGLVQCKICGNCYTQYNLRRHMKRHILENVDCEICGKQFKSKAALATHVRSAHEKREKIYNCTFCEKTFERQRYLKEHIDMHTGRKEYNCSYCPREFRSKANMYAHVKKIHSEQWAEAKRARNPFKYYADKRVLDKINPSCK